MPFGLKNAPATFQRLINTVLEGLYDFTVCFIDDICVYFNDWKFHIADNRVVFERLHSESLTINLSKCEFCSSSILYLGHVVGSGKVLPSDAKVKDILSLPAPQNKKMVRQFLGAVGFYRIYIKNFCEMSFPLTDLLKKNVKFKWTDACERAFKNLRSILATSPVLSAPNFNTPFSMAADCSDGSMGSVLFQVENNMENQ